MTARNPVSGEVKRMSWNDFKDLLIAPEIVERVQGMLARPCPEAHGVVCYEVLQMDSSQYRHRQFMLFGPGCTYKTIDQAAAGRLGDTPSRFAYPVAYFEKDQAT